jgi:hypothetical protein
MTTYLAYFDTSGFEFIFNITEYEQKKVWAILKEDKTFNEKTNLPVYCILRARANPQRFPEIWKFNSDLPLEALNMVAKDTPQVLVDAIRQGGESVFVTQKEKSVIV